MVTRRSFLAQAAPLALVPWVACSNGSRAQPRPATTARGPGWFAFLHGVASGDPQPDAVILWTRLSWVDAADAADGPVDGAEPVAPATVTWVVARDPDLLDVVQSGQAEASAAADYTVKVDVRELAPGMTYHYQFRAA